MAPGAGLDQRHIAPGQPPSAEKPSGIPRQALPSPSDKSHFPAEIQEASKIKNLVTHWLWGKWLLLRGGFRGLGTQQGVGRRLLTRLIQGQDHSLSTWRWGSGGPT